MIALPPLIDPSRQINGGTLRVQVGSLLNLNKAKNENLKIKVSFWGQEKTPSEQVTLRTLESNLDFEISVDYKICVEQTIFENYLKQGKKIFFSLLDHRNDTQVGEFIYDLGSFGEKICSIKKKTDIIGQIKMTVAVEYGSRDEPEIDENEKEVWSQSYRSQEFKQDQVTDLKKIQQIAQDIEKQSQIQQIKTDENSVNKKEIDIDDQEVDHLFEEILKKGHEIHQKLEKNTKKSTEKIPPTAEKINLPQTQFSTINRPPPIFPELQTLSNDIDLIKIQQTDQKKLKQLEDNIQEPPLIKDFCKFVLSSFQINNQNAQKYLLNKFLTLKCILPNQNSVDMNFQIIDDQNIKISQEIPFNHDLKAQNPSTKIQFKILIADENREIGSASFKYLFKISLTNVFEPLKRNYCVSVTTQVPFDRLNPSNQEKQPEQGSLQKIESESELGEILLVPSQGSQPIKIQPEPVRPKLVGVFSSVLKIYELSDELADCQIKFMPFAPPKLQSPPMSQDSIYQRMIPLPELKPPFLLLEFWKNDALLGIFKTNIPNNISTEGKYGVVVEDGVQNLNDLKNQKLGSFKILFVIGNLAQIDFWHEKLEVQNKQEQQKKLEEVSKLEQIKQDQQKALQEAQEKIKASQFEEEVRFAPQQVKQSFLNMDNISRLPNRAQNFDQFRNDSQIEGDLLQTLITFFEDIRRNREKLSQQIQYIITSDDMLTLDKFVEFVKSLDLNLNDSKIGSLLRIFDFTKQQGNYLNLEIDMKELAMSYSAYFKYESVIRDEYESIFRNLGQLIKGGSKQIKLLFQRFNDLLISKDQFQSILNQQHLDSQETEKLTDLMLLPDQNNLIFYPQFWEYPRQLELHGELKYLQPNSKIFVKQFNQTLNFPQIQINQEVLDLLDIQNLLKDYDLSHSRLDALLFLHNIEQSMITEMKVEKQFIEAFVQQKQNIQASQVFTVHDNIDDIDEIQKILNQDKKPDHHESSVSGIYKNESINETNSDIHDYASALVKNKSTAKNISNHEQELVKSQFVSQSKMEQNGQDQFPEFIPKSTLVQNQDANTKNQPFNFINHHFKIKIIKVYDYNPQTTDDSYFASYQFPTFEKNVDSPEFSLHQSEEKQINFKSNHLITLQKEEDLQNFFINKTKGIQISLKKTYPYQKIIAQTVIPIYDLFDLFQNIDYKTFTKNKAKIQSRYVLYETNQSQKTFGIVQIKLSYHCEPSFNSVIMQKETSVERLLPKNGIILLNFLNVHFLKENINQPYYTYIRCDFFHQNRNIPSLIVKTDRVKNDSQYDIKYRFGQDIQLNEMILSYFKNNSALIQFIAETNSNTVVLGSTKLPLIEMITNIDGIKGDLPIFSEDNIFVGSIRAQIKYDQKSSFEKGLKEIQSANILISLNHMLNYLLPLVSFQRENKAKKLMYFQINVSSQSLVSPTFIFQNDQKQILLENYDFLLGFDNIFELQNDLEIKLFEKEGDQDELFAFCKLNLVELVKELSAHQRYQNYFTFVCAKSSRPIKLRLGMIIQAFLCSQHELDSQSYDLENLLYKDESMYSNQENILAKKMKFSKDSLIFNDSQQEIFIQEENLIEKLQKEFNFYDYENSGLFDFEDAKRIMVLYEEKFEVFLFIKKMNTPLLQTFKYENYIDYHQDQYNLLNHFDSIQFLTKIRFNKPIQQIIQNPRYLVKIKRGVNFQSLNNNIPPNSFLIFQNKKTQLQIRQQNPIFNESFEIDSDTLIEVGNSQYSRQKNDSIRQETIIASGYIKLDQSQQRIELIQQGQRTNAYLEISIEQILSENQEVVEEVPLEQDMNLVYENIEKTLKELNQTMKESKIMTKNQTGFQSSNQRQEVPQRKQQTFGSTLEKLSQLNLDLDANFQSLGSFTIENQDKQNLQNPFQNHIESNKENLQENKQEVPKMDKFIIDEEVESKLISEQRSSSKLAFPSLQKSLSFKKLEEKLKQSDQQELDRIASIMKQDFSKSMKLYELSSDSD